MASKVATEVKLEGCPANRAAGESCELGELVLVTFCELRDSEASEGRHFPELDRRVDGNCLSSLKW